jgi:neutral ceramidase
VKKFIKIVGFIMIFLAILLAICIKPIDRQTYTQKPHYTAWKQSVKELSFVQYNEQIKAGWAKVNITPAKPMAMAGYGVRKGKPDIAVHDSVFVRAICLETGGQKSYLVSADLLIIPPSVYTMLKSRLFAAGVNIENVHFAATHSHNSLGSWGNTITGKLFAGPYDPAVETFLTEKITEAIGKASQNLVDANISYGETVDSTDVRNRLEVENPGLDAELRSLQIERTDGRKASLLTYAAHSTVLNSSTYELSRDYSGVLVDSLEKTYDFAMFMAGAVGSMGPVEKGSDDFDEVHNQGRNIFIKAQNIAYAAVGEGMVQKQLTLPLASASPKISQNWALREFVFKILFGDFSAHIKITKLGNTLMLGMPCDFSGELMTTLDAYAKKKGLNLIITSFNGSYIGYITADRHYDKDLYETRTMAWYGTENGAYFSEIVRDIIDKIVIG